MDDLISRETVLRCIVESREGIDWGQSEDEDAFLHYTGALYRTIASSDCLPTIDAIPVEWLRGLKEKLYGNSNGLAYRMLLDVILNMWQKEHNKEE